MNEIEVSTMGKVKDPTRIPTLLDAVRSVWEGQPDLSFGAIVGILENHGMSWGSTDDEILAIAQEIVQQQPPRLTSELLCRGPYVVTTVNPDCRYTINTHDVVVDRGKGSPLTAWAYSEIAQSAVGGPLKLVDSNGIVHRLGIVTLISALDSAPDRHLVICTAEDGGNEYVDIQFPLATVVTKERRELTTATYRLKERPLVKAGEELVLSLATDEAGVTRQCGVVTQVLEVG